MKVKRIKSGHYRLEVGGRFFQAGALDVVTEEERYGGWRLLLEKGGTPPEFDWCNDFWTLKQCKEAAQKTADELNGN